MKTSSKKVNKARHSRSYFVVPFAFLFFFLILYLVYNNIKERAIKEFNNEQIMLAKTASQGISSFFSDYQTTMQFISQLKSVSTYSNDTDSTLSQFYEIHKEIIAAITRVDSNGVILCSFPNNKESAGQNISGQAHVKQILTTHQPVISDVFLSVQGFLAVAIHVPVFENNVFAGSLAMLFPVEKLGRKYLGEVKARGTGSIFLLSEKGIELYCSDPGHAGKPFVDNEHNPVDIRIINGLLKEWAKIENVKNDEESIVVDSERFNRQFVAYYHAPLGNTYWTIIIRTAEKDVNLGLAKLRNRLMLAFFFLFLVIAYYFYSVIKFRNAIKDEEKRQATEKTLRESEARFRTIFDESPIGILLYNAEGILLSSNKASMQMFGTETEKPEFLKLFDEKFFDISVIEKLKDCGSIAYQTEIDFDKINQNGLFRINRKGTSIFDFIITSLPGHNNQKAEGYLLQVQDITDRIRAEEEISMLAHSLKSVNECVSITDMNDQLIFVNESFCNTYGYTKEELIGKHLEMLRSPNNPPGLVDQILPSTIDGEWKGELLNKRKDGTEFPIYLSTTTIKDKDNNPIGLIGVAADITERKHKEAELIKAIEKAEESDRLKSSFLANMSHEIRTPMNGILGFTELLSDTHFSGKEKQEFIDIIRKSGQRMLNTVNDLIDIAKIETGQMPLIYTETDLIDQITNLYRFFQHEAEEKGVVLSLNCSVLPHLAKIKTDVAKLDSIFTNLIKNAIKYTDKGTVEIGCRMHERNFVFYVRDTGIGIPKHRQQAIFNRFEQADISDTRAFQGSGLGLAITKAYAEMLGGKIELDSEEGRGSTFFFSFPVELETNSIQNPSENDLVIEPKKAKSSLKILVAEDDDISYYFLLTILNELKCETIRCINGVEAVDICSKNNDIDLILMDIRMPLMNGLEATKRIREFNSTVVIIAQTAFALLGDKDVALDAGCNDYISKPINKTDLIAKIRKNTNCVE